MGCFLEREMISSPVIGQKGYSRLHADHDFFRLRLTLLLSRRAGGRPAERGVRGAARVCMDRVRAAARARTVTRRARSRTASTVGAIGIADGRPAWALVGPPTPPPPS